MSYKVKSQWIFISFIVIGIALSILNFMNFRSLWLDEAMVALNIVNKPALELLQPLDHRQVAPIGFLLIEKLFASILGNTDWSMRIFPLISFLISIPLLYQASYKILKNKLFALCNTAFFVTTFIIISYSSEVKQYIVDVTFALIILCATIIYKENDLKNRWKLYALIGAISIWFSNIAVIILFSCGLYSIYKVHHSIEKKYMHLAKILGIWIISFLVYFKLFIYDHPTKGTMMIYWKNAGAFIPQNIFSLEFYKSVYRKFRILFELFGSEKVYLLLIPIFLLGVIFLAKKKKDYLYLLIFPLVLHLILSYLHLYPFDTRLILYLYPNLLIITFCGFLFINSLFQNHKQKLLYVLSLFLIMNIFFLFKSGFPIKKEEIKESMTYINSEFKKGDNIYVYYGAVSAFNFYKNILFSNPEIEDSTIVKTIPHRDNWSEYQKSIVNMNDSVWILFSHVFWKKNKEDLNEDEYIIQTFINNGYQIIDQQKYQGSSAYHAVKTNSTLNQ